jgi:hypothetical protein
MIARFARWLRASFRREPEITFSGDGSMWVIHARSICSRIVGRP